MLKACKIQDIIGVTKTIPHKERGLGGWQIVLIYFVTSGCGFQWGGSGALVVKDQCFLFKRGCYFEELFGGYSNVNMLFAVTGRGFSGKFGLNMPGLY
ncbi:hypothetical protein NC651_012562 [Populus alba x Populus x berolinensis]|nr:hypothetical protein NC651_012562 [Populus alba x Populus x berolinensis]